MVKKISFIKRTFLIGTFAVTLSFHFISPLLAEITIGGPAPVIPEVEKSNLASVKSLISSGQSPNSANPDGIHVLAIAARQGDLAMISLLLELTADINFMDKNGQTALHWAVINLKPNALKLLLDNKANVNAVNANGETPLMLAAKAGDNNLIKILLKAGADASITDYTGRNAKDWALHSRNPNAANLF